MEGELEQALQVGSQDKHWPETRILGDSQAVQLVDEPEQVTQVEEHT